MLLGNFFFTTADTSVTWNLSFMLKSSSWKSKRDKTIIKQQNQKRTDKLTQSQFYKRTAKTKVACDSDGGDDFHNHIACKVHFVIYMLTFLMFPKHLYLAFLDAALKQNFFLSYYIKELFYQSIKKRIYKIWVLLQTAV